MATNDSYLLDGLIEDRLVSNGPGSDKGEVFEELACEQLLKEYDFSPDEIFSGQVDGEADGGVDGFYIMVNGHLLNDPESFIWPKSGADLHVVLLNCKHHDTFKLQVLDKLVATLGELLNFAVPTAELTGAYSELVLTCRANLMFAYRKLSPKLDNFTISISYASRGEVAKVGGEVNARALQLESQIAGLFGDCFVKVGFVGAAELIALYRLVPSYTLELPFVDSLAKGERYVVLARLTDYFSFVSDSGKLRRYLFESNVRDYLGNNPVNDDIQATLNQSDSPDFWWLNNGVTILATSASIVGKSIKASEIQIVNGLQTTESIHRHFLNAPSSVDDRCLLVRVIVTSDSAVRDAIIRATNNQSKVELASLHATDKIQRDIEDALAAQGLWYDRRKNYYANQGHPQSEIVTPLYVAAGYVALILRCPHKASVLRSRFMRDQSQYEGVFSQKAPLAVWPAIARILKRVDAELEVLKPKKIMKDRYLQNSRYVVAFLLVSIHFKKFSFGISELIAFDSARIDAKSVSEILSRLNRIETESKKNKKWSNYINVFKACEVIAKEDGISDIGSIKVSFGHDMPKPSKPAEPSEQISDQLIESVRQKIPRQPWKPGMHKALCIETGCSPSAIKEIVSRLIDDGVFLNQKDGVLFDQDGNVHSFDPERVDPKTMMLLSVS